MNTTTTTQRRAHASRPRRPSTGRFRLCGGALVALFSLLAAGLMATPAGASGGSVGNLSVSITPPTAGTAFVTYTLSFVATDGIAAWNGELFGGTNGGISIVAPNGTDLCSASVVTLIDHSTPADSDTGGIGWHCGNPNNTLTIRLPNAVGAGDSVTMTVEGVTNPNVPGNYSLTLSTNKDPGPVSTGYSIVTGHISNVAVAAQPAIPGATSTYDLTFVATHGISAWSGTLFGGTNGGISIVAPNGTNFSQPDESRSRTQRTRWTAMAQEASTGTAVTPETPSRSSGFPMRSVPATP